MFTAWHQTLFFPLKLISPLMTSVGRNFYWTRSFKLYEGLRLCTIKELLSEKTSCKPSAGVHLSQLQSWPIGCVRGVDCFWRILNMGIARITLFAVQLIGLTVRGGGTDACVFFTFGIILTLICQHACTGELQRCWNPLLCQILDSFFMCLAIHDDTHTWISLYNWLTGLVGVWSWVKI